MDRELEQFLTQISQGKSASEQLAWQIERGETTLGDRTADFVFLATGGLPQDKPPLLEQLRRLDDQLRSAPNDLLFLTFTVEGHDDPTDISPQKTEHWSILGWIVPPHGLQITITPDEFQCLIVPEPLWACRNYESAAAHFHNLLFGSTSSQMAMMFSDDLGRALALELPEHLPDIVIGREKIERWLEGLPDNDLRQYARLHWPKLQAALTGGC